MPLSAGDKLEILAPHSAGGMGEVYRAKDTKLGRQDGIEYGGEWWILWRRFCEEIRCDFRFWGGYAPGLSASSRR